MISFRVIYPNGTDGSYENDIMNELNWDATKASFVFFYQYYSLVISEPVYAATCIYIPSDGEMRPQYFYSVITFSSKRLSLCESFSRLGDSFNSRGNVPILSPSINLSCRKDSCVSRSFIHSLYIALRYTQTSNNKRRTSTDVQNWFLYCR